VKVDTAAGISEIRGAVRRIDFAYGHLQPLSHAPQLGDIHAVPDRDLAEPAAPQLQDALGKVLVVDQEHADLGEVVPAGPQVLLGDPVFREDALDVEVVDREVSRAADRRARVAASRSIRDAIHNEIAHVVGEAEHHAVAARDLPAGGERRHLARKVLGQFGAGGLHLRLGSSR
jgi:hypothetical protein